MNFDRFLKVVREAIGTSEWATSDAVVGSSYIHQEIRNDVDILVLSPFRRSLRDVFTSSGWVEGGSQDLTLNTCWVSMKKLYDDEGKAVVINVIIVENEDYFNKWVRAAEACRFLVSMGVPLKRGQTHGVHAIIMDDCDAEGELPLRNYD